MTVDQFTGRSEDELVEMAVARDIAVPPDAEAPQLRRALRRHREVCHIASGSRLGDYRYGRAPEDDFETRVDADVRRALHEGGLWTVRALRAATFHSGEEVRASLSRIAARGDGTGAYYLPGAERQAERDRTAASGGER